MRGLLVQSSRKAIQFLPVYFEYSVILMLHRVGIRNPRRIPANQNMVISPTELDDFIIDCKKKGWSFISLDELVDNIKNRISLRKTLLLTFDDGYLDNFLEAAPVLISHSVPFVVYVSTGFIETQETPWWYSLEAKLASCQHLSLPDGSTIAVDSLEEKQAAFLLIRQKMMSSIHNLKKYKNWIDINCVIPSVEHNRLFMNWSEVEHLANLPNVTIGAHTHSHPVLSRLSDDDAFEEIIRSKKILEKRLDKQVKHFAYPFGGPDEASQREFRQIEALGFESAVTTRMGAIDHIQINKYALPRCFYKPELTLDFLQKQLFEHKLINIAKRLFMRD